MNIRIYTITIFSLFLISLFFYFPFSAEDSYIVGRYAYNFGTYGELAYNIEEPISALTSPLHAILEGIMYSTLKYDPVIIWKFFSIFLLIITVHTLSSVLTSNSQKIFFLIAVLLSSSTLIWTIGGLETPLLMYLVSISTIIFLSDDIKEKNTLLKLSILFGLMFITRFDSAIFMLPMTLYIVWVNRYSYKNIFIFFILAIALISLWFLVSKLYYGHFMPTSFFAKKPELSLTALITTIRGFFWTGILPILLYSIFLKKNKNPIAMKNIIMYISLLSFILYMFTMANKHMMFSFRPFIPYLPISFMLLILYKKEITKVMIKTLFIFQSSQLYITYAYGINYPISEIIENKLVPDTYQKYFYKEYSLLNIPTYIKFMNILKEQGNLITLDWKKNHTNRKAVVYTYAEGIASYSARNEFFTGNLVTKGACKKPDYIMGLHFLDLQLNRDIDSNNAFISNKLNYYISKDRQKQEFSVSRFQDLNEKNKKAVVKILHKCNKEIIW